MFLSVIIPTYNRAHVIAEAVESILQQFQKSGRTDVELIVVDDGSTDKSLEKLATFGQSITLLTQKNSGPGAARNTGARAAKGTWLTFLDSDDLWAEGRLHGLLKDLKNLPENVVAHICDMQFLSETYDRTFFEVKGFTFSSDTPTIVDRPLANLLSGCGIICSAVRANFWHTLEGLDENMRMYEDTDFICRLSLYGKFAFVARPDIIARRVVGGAVALTNVEKSAPLRAIEQRIIMFERLLNEKHLHLVSPTEKNQISKSLSAHCLEAASHHSVLSRTRFSYLGRSAQVHPNTIIGLLKAVIVLFGGTSILKRRNKKKLDRS
jgi:glycosyltransferase involved in cell wall biosynthesis